MFTSNALRSLLNARPFVPFRFILSDGGAVDVRHSEIVLPGKQFAVVGLLEPTATDMEFDRWAVVWYMHVTRVDFLKPGAPPFASPPPGTSQSPTPSPA